MLITEFSYVDMPYGDWFAGMCTKPNKKTEKPPKKFETFQFFIDKAPEHEFEIFNIPNSAMFEAATLAKFNKIDFVMHYPDPELKDHPIIRKYIDELHYPDYLMKLRVLTV